MMGELMGVGVDGPPLRDADPQVAVWWQREGGRGLGGGFV